MQHDVPSQVILRSTLFLVLEVLLDPARLLLALRPLLLDGPLPALLLLAHLLLLLALPLPDLLLLRPQQLLLGRGLPKGDAFQYQPLGLCETEFHSLPLASTGGSS